MLADRRDPVGAVLEASSLIGPAIPKDTTGPKSGSSMLLIETGTPGGAFFCTTNPALSVLVMSAVSDSQATRISAEVSMLRHTCARSGRSLRWPAVAFSTTSRPSRTPAFWAARRLSTARSCQQSTPYAARSAVTWSGSRSTPSGCPRSASLISFRAPAESTSVTSSAAPSGVRSHTA